MFMYVLSLSLIVLSVTAAPQLQPVQPAAGVAQSGSDTTPVPIISQFKSNNPDGSFNSSYEAGNGIKEQSSGFLKTIQVPTLRDDGTETGEKQDAQIIVQTGSYSYTAPDGQVITVTYVADENGFQPVGDHIPTPPAIPEQILNSLKQQSSDASAQQTGAPFSQPPSAAPVVAAV